MIKALNVNDIISILYKRGGTYLEKLKKSFQKERNIIRNLWIVAIVSTIVCCFFGYCFRVIGGNIQEIYHLYTIIFIAYAFVVLTGFAGSIVMIFKGNMIEKGNLRIFKTLFI